MLKSLFGLLCIPVLCANSRENMRQKSVLRTLTDTFRERNKKREKGRMCFNWKDV